MRWTPRQLADATGGRVVPDTAGADRLLWPLTIDSREVGEGAVFVPVVAERDGHLFVAAAVAAGAGAFLYQPDRLEPGLLAAGAGDAAGASGVAAGATSVAAGATSVGGAAGVEVADTGAALLDIGRAARRRLAGPVVGITGSVGKTSTKDLAAATVGAGRRVTASTRSFNNELGVPLTLANAAEDTEVTIVEMGARGAGHIALLCDVARPTMAVVTSVAAVHTELFGDLEAVARAKGELVEALPSDGTAILNGDDPAVAGMAARTDAETLLYGVARDDASGRGVLDVVAEEVVLDDELRAGYVLRSPWGSAPIVLAVRGSHQVGNSLAALTVALRLGVPLDDAVGALASAASSQWRMDLRTAPSGARILNDAYNANPTSMAAALRGLRRLPARRRVAVLGAMAELGPDGPSEHRRIAALAGELGIDVVAVGTTDYGVEPVAGIGEAVSALGRLGAGDAVLVKASRVAGLELLAERLLAPG